MPMYLASLTLVFALVVAACSGLPPQPAVEPAPPSLPLALPALRSTIEGVVRTHLEGEEDEVRRWLRRGQGVDLLGVAPLTRKVLENPWDGLIKLESLALSLMEKAGSERGIGAVVQLIESDRGAPVARSTLEVDRRKEPMAFIVEVLTEATRLRERALRDLHADEREFLFAHAAPLVEHFLPQVTDPSPTVNEQVEADVLFYRLVGTKLDQAAMREAAAVLSLLADGEWLRVLRAHPPKLSQASLPPGITGDVWGVQRTPFGHIIIGGPGPTSYDISGGMAVIIDVGGDDLYRGTLAAPASSAQGLAMIIDLDGHDTYRGRPLGLATGRLGVGLLVDLAGDDVYELDAGAGGTGFAGVGILHDHAGHDRYVGNKLTQGAGIGGLGIVMDRAGDDEYRAFGYAMGFGGPLGAGLVVDLKGDDRYHCANHYPSNYNEQDAPTAQAGDPQYQYDAFCIGVGSGTRRMTGQSTDRGRSVAGGLGMMLDATGNDGYASSNFSQGAGYYFGIGVKVDGAGQDVHAAARYGHGAAAHYGVALFIDASGDDDYTSSGPFYNGGTAWDASVALMVDAGNGEDLYAFERSDGLARADHHGWAFFVDEGGHDRYVLSRGMGRATDGSLGGFFDLQGQDDYQVIEEVAGRGNGVTAVHPAGGIFVDR